MGDPYHAGERFIQELVGERAAALRSARAVFDRLPGGAGRFISQQDLIILGSRSAGGEVWATVLCGTAGFAQAREPDTLHIELPHGSLQHLVEGAALATLFIEFSTRRRFRVNGHVFHRDRSGISVRVQAAYANCAKYIHQRSTLSEGSALDGPPRQGDCLDDESRAWIASANTFFVASGHPSGMDASHRGGPPGFVEQRGHELWIPDYPGNGMFNTLGNLRCEPQAGLTFPDFARGRQLQLTGTTRLELGDGAEDRWWVFRPERWRVSCLSVQAPRACSLSRGPRR